MSAMATKKTTTAAEPTPARAMFDVMGAVRDEAHELVDKIPNERFGSGRARILRKMVLLAIAANANPDGTNAYPSLEVIAHRCLVTVQAVQKVIAWLTAHGLLRKETKGRHTSKHGTTNVYTILFGTPATIVVGDKDRTPETSVAGDERTPETTVPEHLKQPKGTPETTGATPATAVSNTCNSSCNDRPDRPSPPPPNQTAPQPTVERLAGWLAQQLPALYRIKTGRVVDVTAKEKQGLTSLIDGKGLPKALAAFYYFLGREQGFDGVVHPYALFLKESQMWLQVRKERKEELSYTQDVEEAVCDLIDKFDVNPHDHFGTHHALCELVELHSDLTGSSPRWNHEVVGRYLDFLYREEQSKAETAKAGH